MNLQKEFRSLILPVIKGAPIIIIFLIVGFLFITRTIIYSVPEYQTSGSIKIDMRDVGVNDFDLFNTGGINYGAMNNFLTEVEIFNSRHLKEKAMSTLSDFFISYHRVGKIKTVELYEDRPFVIQYKVKNPKILDKEQTLIYVGDGQFQFTGSSVKEPMDVSFGKTFSNKNIEITVIRQDSFLMDKPSALKEGDNFHFIIHSIEKLAKDVNAKNLFIKPVDKEVYVVKIYYQHQIPEKAAKFVNALMEAYINDDLDGKGYQAGTTIEFIDSELIRVGGKLKGIEGRLAMFKRNNEFTNPTMETDAVLKQLADLDKQKLAYDIAEIELMNVQTFLNTEQDITDFSPDFQAINDGVFKSSYTQLQALNTKKQDLLKEFTQTSSEVLNINSKINDSKKFILETIEKKIINLKDKKAELESSATTAKTKYESLPDKERQLVELERELMMTEQTYTFLAKKRTEVAVASSANYSYHEIIDYARVPEESISPNVPLMYGIAIFLSLLFSLVVVYIRSFFVATLGAKVDINERTEAPLLAAVNRIGDEDQDNIEPLINLYTNLQLYFKSSDQNIAKTIVVSSQDVKEGKTFISVKLSKIMAQYDHNVLLIDMNVHNPDIHNYFDLENFIGVSTLLKEDISPIDVVQNTEYENLDVITAGQLANISSTLVFSPKFTKFIDTFKEHYDMIIIDTPPTSKVRDAVPLMHISDINLFILRAYMSKLRKLSNIDQYIEEYKIPNLYLTINGLRSKPSTYRDRNKNFISKILNRFRK